MAAHVRKIARAEALALLNAQGGGLTESEFAATFSAIEVGRTGTTETGDLYFYVNLPESTPLPGTSLGKPSGLTGEDYDNVYEIAVEDAEGNPAGSIKVAHETAETITIGSPFFPAQFAGVPVE